jgi:hypothetical protein
MMISADNFWIELDRLLGAPATPERIEALMESYGPVWPDIHDRAINSPDHFRSHESVGHLRNDASGSAGEDWVARGVTRQG